MAYDPDLLPAPIELPPETFPGGPPPSEGGVYGGPAQPPPPGSDFPEFPLPGGGGGPAPLPGEAPAPPTPTEVPPDQAPTITPPPMPPPAAPPLPGGGGPSSVTPIAAGSFALPGSTAARAFTRRGPAAPSRFGPGTPLAGSFEGGGGGFGGGGGVGGTGAEPTGEDDLAAKLAFLLQQTQR